jgi:UDP-4-amino-4,6-dideoxy-N-acetyl-beta-L-altrosamine transaminase
MKPIPYGKQDITEEDILSVIEVLISDYLTQGPEIAKFEKAFASYLGAKYAVAVANGTAALHLCAMALGVQPGDKVITSPITFAASANCVRYCGGEVVFADINPETYLLDIENVRALLAAAPKGTYKGIIPVDFAGRAVDLEAFKTLADEFGCWMIEDACHAPGGFFTNSEGVSQPCGNGRYADLAIFSFHPVKHIAAGEGGMITTNSKELYEKLLTLRTHGITKQPTDFLNTPELATFGHSNTTLPESELASQPPSANRQPPTYPGWYMEMQTLGYNYRLTDFQAALGNSQLKRAEEGLKRRHAIAAKYFDAFQSIPQITDRNKFAQTARKQRANSQQPTANSQQPTANPHAHHLYVIEVPNRLELYNYLRQNNIFAQIHYFPVHLMPYYQNLGWKPGDFPKAEAYYSQCISLPIYPSMTDAEVDYVIQAIIAFYSISK